MTLKEALEKLKSGDFPSGLRLDLGRNEIDDEGVQALAKALASGNCPSGFRLDLRENKIRNKGAQALAAALMSGNCPLRFYLDLSGNEIGNKGVQALAHALKSGNCQSGLKLNLFNNIFGAKGAQALAHALKSGNCPSGLRLNLNFNIIGDKGAQAFADALASGKSPSGLELELSDNDIGEKGAQALAKALKSGKCRFGTTIYLHNKTVDFAELSKANDRIIQKSTSLKLITLIGGYAQCKRHVPLTAKSKLPEDVVNHIAKFLPGNISVSILLNKLEHFFTVTLNNTADFSDEFLQKHSGLNQRIQTQYDKKFGLSLWQCTEDYRKRYLEKNPIKTGSSDRKMCAIL